MTVRHTNRSPDEPVWNVVGETEFFYNVTLPHWQSWTVPVPKEQFEVFDATR